MIRNYLLSGVSTEGARTGKLNGFVRISENTIKIKKEM